MFVGSYGSFWVSDEFDKERMYFFAFFAIPLAIAVPYAASAYPSFWKKNPQLLRLLIAITLFSQTWGGLLFLNAAIGSTQVPYQHFTNSSIEQQYFRTTYRRGRFGWLHRLRW